MDPIQSDQQTIIPISEEERMMAQENALEKLQKKEFVPQSARVHEVNIDDYVADLTAAFQNGFNVDEACSYIGINPSTYYRHLKKNPSFAEKMERAKLFTELKAKERVTQILVKGSDRDAGPMARWLLEKKQPDIYGSQTIIQQNNQKNTYVNLSYEEVSELVKQLHLDHLGPVELLEALEEASMLDEKKDSSPLS
ncbi:MAG TPA: hypothetical protein VNW29_01990 [Candidatus Sulfotelmatobacter sp.]|jgi:hypothetical protein|nr:hypothetical protein [Candidatus Sulfotelmatobacter sp.]